MYVEVAAHVLINAHGIIRRVAHEAQAAGALAWWRRREHEIQEV